MSCKRDGQLVWVHDYPCEVRITPQQSNERTQLLSSFDRKRVGWHLSVSLSRSCSQAICLKSNWRSIRLLVSLQGLSPSYLIIRGHMYFPNADKTISKTSFVHTQPLASHNSLSETIHIFEKYITKTIYTGALLYEQHRAGPKIDHTRGFLTIELTRGLL